MALRKIPIRRAGNRDNLFMGGDRELVMFSGVLAFALIFNAQELRATTFGLVLWFGALFVQPTQSPLHETSVDPESEVAAFRDRDKKST